MRGMISLRAFRLPAAAAALLLMLLQVAQVAHGHGSLKIPRSRNDIFFNTQWSATAGNGLGPRCSGPFPFGAPSGFCRPAGQPGVCGDPYQEVSPSTNIAAISGGPIQATYTSGQTVTFSVLMQVNHGGRMAFRLCDRRTNLDQACFNARPLLRADNNKPNWYILSGRYEDPPTTMTMTYKLPTGFSCPNGCVIQWEYFTYNTCLEACPRDECGSYADRMNYIIPAGAGQGPKPLCSAGGPPPEIFYNCADVVITGGGGGTIPPPVPSPSPSPRPPSPSPIIGSDPCPGIAPGQSRAACFCRKNPIGRYQDVTYGCSGGFWCYSGGSQHIPCASGLRYDPILGVCNWASSVTCGSSSIVGPASAVARRPRRAFRPRAPVNATEAAVVDSAEPTNTAATTVPAVSDEAPLTAAVPSDVPARPPVVDNADEVVAAAAAPAEVPAPAPQAEGNDSVAAAPAAADAATAGAAATQAADVTSGAPEAEQPAAVPTDSTNPDEAIP